MDATARRRSVDTLGFAKSVISKAAESLSQLGEQLDANFLSALKLIGQCRGAVLVTGIGKAGLIGQKLSATLCSTGTRSFFLHPAEAIHGDLGRVTKDDVVIVMSMSGETEELTRILPSIQKLSGGMIAITSTAHNTLAQRSDVVITLGKLSEADTNGLAPSTSTTAMLAVGDALALTISHQRGFTAADFAQYHPGGSLGRKLTRVAEMMRPLDDCRVARLQQTVRESFVTLRRTGRRTGAVMIVDDDGVLRGIFTDSDLARLLESQSDAALETTVQRVMTTDPLTVSDQERMPEAIRILAEYQISELPVVNDEGKPVGLIDITDLVSWLPDSDGPHPSPRLLPFPGDPT